MHLSDVAAIQAFYVCSLPKWLKGAYVYTRTFDECVKDGVKLINK